MGKVESSQSVLLESLTNYYKDPAAFETFRLVSQGKAEECKMSLRILDWLVTNYSKKHHIVYQVNVGGRLVMVDIYRDYKLQLKGYSKKFFDPFCRRQRIVFNGLDTTCGQLNFFRWAQTYGVLQYALDHHDEIEQHMLETIEQRMAEADGEPGGNTSRGKRKRKELSKAAVKTYTRTVVKVKFTFT